MEGNGLTEEPQPVSRLGFAVADTSPHARRVALVIIAAMSCLATATIVLAREPGPRVHAFLPLLTGSVIVTELLSAFLLLGQFARTRVLPLLPIGAAYLYAASLAVPYILTFPNVFSPSGLFGADGQTALYLWMLWHAGFPLLVLTGILLRSSVPAPISKRASSLLLATIIAACTLFAYGACVGLVRASTHLPVLIADGHFTEQATSGVLPVICLFDGLALIALVSRTRGRTIAELWLTVAVVASLLDSIMGLICARYSYGWYAGKLFSMVSSSIVIAAFIYEITSLQSRLAAANGELLKLNEQERQAARQRLVYLAYHDPLTSLPNRSRWEEILEKSTSQAVAFSTPFALLFVDLDRFKEINDTVGHTMGDRLLVEASKRLQATLRPKDVIGRFGGDEFVVLTGELTDPIEASTLAQDLRDAIRKPFVFGERAFHVGASVGIALFPADGSTAGLLLNHADAACYQAKRAGGDCERFYTREIGDELHHRREVYDALVEAIENHAFTLYYQPLFDLRTKRVDCVEALIRWKDSSGQLVPAATFIPIAEQSGLMHSIGGWVLEEALSQARRWADDGLELRIAINVSACQLQQPGFFESLRGALEAAHVDPGMLEIEVTESATLADPAIAYEQLERCKALGVRIALDDFGTYYSSLTYLQRLPIDSIKIDRSFVRGLPFNVQDTAIVRAVITLGHELGRTIVAEGVETPEQLHWLENAGCDVIQGYHIAKPMPASSVVEWLRQRQSPARTKAHFDAEHPVIDAGSPLVNTLTQSR